MVEIYAATVLALVTGIFTLAFKRWDAFQRFETEGTGWVFCALAFGAGLALGGVAEPYQRLTFAGFGVAIVGLAIAALLATIVADLLAAPDRNDRP